MKKMAFVLLLIVACSSALAGSTAVIEDGLCSVFLHEDDGFLFILEMQKNAQRDGVALQFFSNGAIETIAWYANGTLHGRSRSFWADGQTQALADYYAGLNSGRLEYYDRQGRPILKKTYLHAKPTGTGSYYEEGVLKHQVQYEAGEPVAVLGTELNQP